VKGDLQSREARTLADVKPAYRIVTERLVLRCYELVDAPLLKGAIDASLEHLRDMPWIGGEPQTLDDKLALLRRFRAAFDRDEDLVYGIFDRDESQLLGGTGLHARVGAGALEIGYWIGRAHVGRGFATEAAGALTRIGFEVHRLDRVEIHCGPENRVSARVAAKLGYRCEATLRGRARDADGRPRDTMVWSLFAEEYPASPAVAFRVEAFDALRRRLM
jgi:RimJ/RimL family protein N-acetyltransferase